MKKQSSRKRVNTCDHCGQSKTEWKESVTLGMVRALFKLHERVRETGENDVYIGDKQNQNPIQLTHGEKCNWSKLRYHGLVYKIRREDGSPIQGHWGLSQRGYDFLHRRKQIHKYVWSYNKHISDAPDARSQEMVTVRDIIKKDIVFHAIEGFESRPHEESRQEELL